MTASLSFGKATRLTSGSAVDLRPNWNAEGRSIIFERQEGESAKLYRIGRDGDGLELAVCTAPGVTVQGRPAFFALDDFAFVSNQTGTFAIWRCRSATGELTQLTHAAQNDYGPAALPGETGRFLFFRETSGKTQIYQALPGQLPTPLTDANAKNNQPWYLPTGDFVFHSDRDGVDAVYRQAPTPGAVAVRLTDPPEGEKTPYVTPYPSPDGAFIAFASARSGRSHIWVMRADGSEARQVTQGDVSACFPAWSPDGTELVFVRGEPLAEENPNGDLWRLSVEYPDGMGLPSDHEPEEKAGVRT